MNAQGCRCVQATVQVPRSPVPVASVPWPRENAPAPHATRWSLHRRAPRRPLHDRAAMPLHPGQQQRSLTTPGPSTLPVAAIGTVYSTQFRPAVVLAYLNSLCWGVAPGLGLCSPLIYKGGTVWNTVHPLPYRTGGQMIQPRRPVLRTRKRCPPPVVMYSARWSGSP